MREPHEIVAAVDGSLVRRFEPHHFPAAHWPTIGFAHGKVKPPPRPPPCMCATPPKVADPGVTCDQRMRRRFELGVAAAAHDVALSDRGRRTATGMEEQIMAWTKPVIREIECGMEINMYGPSEDEGGVLF